MAAIDRAEFRNGLNEISQLAIALVNPFDRVRCCQWCLKLSDISDNNIESAKLRNEYMQLLLIMVRSQFLHGIFLDYPPDGDFLPLAEALGNGMADRIPNLPRVGPIAPAILHKSPDGKASISVKCIPGGGVFCYMAVTPEDEI